MTTTVNSTAGLVAALRSAHAGDTILLAAGTYNSVGLSGLNFATAVTIESADPTHQAVINNLGISGSSGLVFHDVEIGTTTGTAANIVSSQNISFTDDLFQGAGSGIGNAMMIRSGSDGVTVTGSSFEGFGTGINELTANNVAISNNTFHDISGGAIRGTGATNEVITGNIFADANASITNHQDVVYLWQDNTANHVTISGNTYGAAGVTTVQTPPPVTTTPPPAATTPPPVTTAPPPVVTSSPPPTTTTSSTGSSSVVSTSGADASGHTVTVNSVQGLWNALQTAHAGDVIKLAAGTYDNVVLGNFHFSTAVTIESADSGQAVINGLTVGNSSGLTFENLGVQTSSSAAAANVSNSTNVVLDHLTIQGTSQALNGLGVNLRNDDGVVISNSDLSNLGSGVGFQGNTNVIIANNNFHNIATDGIVGGSTNVDVSGNTFSDFHPAVGAHPDAIQFFAAGGVDSQNVTISNNVITRGAGDAFQGIFIEATNNITINNNAMTGTMYDGISVSATSNASITNNFVQGFADMDSRIITRGASENVSVIGNSAETILNYQPNGVVNPNYVQSGNTTIGAANVGDLSDLHTWLNSHSSASTAVPSFSSLGWIL